MKAVSATSLIGLAKIVWPAVPEIPKLIQLAVEGKWDSFSTKLEFLGKKYSEDTMQNIILPILIALGGRIASKVLGMKKIFGIPGMDVNINI